MIHYSCDCCKRQIDPEDGLRYVVKMEVYAAFDPVESDELEDDRDHLLEMQEILQSMEEDDTTLGESIYRELRYDLCAECRKKFMKNPLGRDSKQFDFSNN